ncbi:MAG TPA: type II toxin-antitoxin system VapC family toxin [Candidatus Acidoferrum sp.]|nr:type II toxin-antitoxin system VapC family toxin [Candidatus Acidoferrum sp.]
MRFLLDTGVLLWSRAEEYKLNARAKELLSSKSSELFLSAASAWEIAIKYALGTLKLHAPPEAYIPEVLRGMDIHALDVSVVHAIEAGKLPQHHRDPFDRMLVAQANTEQLVLLTADRIFEKYKVEHVFCGK